MPRCDHCGDWINDEEAEETGRDICSVCMEDFEEEEDEDGEDERSNH